jgi:hypothetical protein
LLEEGLSEVIYINSDTQDIEIHTEIATSDTNSLFIMACTMSQSCGYIPLSFKILALEDNQEFLEDLINQAPIFETKTFSLDQELSEEMTFQLPDIFDANADEVTVEVQGLQEGMTYDEETNSIVISQGHVGEYKLKFILTDGRNKKSTHDFTFNAI